MISFDGNLVRDQGWKLKQLGMKEIRDIIFIKYKISIAVIGTGMQEA